jgi:hypothetical protein
MQSVEYVPGQHCTFRGPSPTGVISLAQILAARPQCGGCANHKGR